MQTEYLAKGTPVRYIYNINIIENNTMVETKTFFNVRKIKGKISRRDNTITIQGLVAGDTPEFGLSVVALENTNICLFKGNNSNFWKIREKIRKGSGINNIYFNKLMGGGTGVNNPTCQYK